MNRLEDTIIYILKRAKLKGKDNLSKFELFKYIYLLEVESYKFTGDSFIKDIDFKRYKNGPISVDIYNALNKLEANKYISVTEFQKEDYGYPRHSISLKKNKKIKSLNKSETLFVNSVFASYEGLSIKALKDVVYKTEPMKEIRKKEHGNKIKIGHSINFDCIPLDEEMVELIAG